MIFTSTVSCLGCWVNPYTKICSIPFSWDESFVSFWCLSSGDFHPEVLIRFWLFLIQHWAALSGEYSPLSSIAGMASLPLLLKKKQWRSTPRYLGEIQMASHIIFSYCVHAFSCITCGCQAFYCGTFSLYVSGSVGYIRLRKQFSRP